MLSAGYWLRDWYNDSARWQAAALPGSLKLDFKLQDSSFNLPPSTSILIMS
jgi:hypothetical protein